MDVRSNAPQSRRGKATPTRHIDATAAYELDMAATPIGEDALCVPAEMPAPAVAARRTARPDAGGNRHRAGRAALMLLAVGAAIGLGLYLYETSRPFKDARAAVAAAELKDAVRTSAAAESDTDFSGVWRLDTEIQSSSVGTYEGLQLGYHLQLDQDGNQVSGTGEKISENGRTLPSKARTPISVRGTIDGNQLALTFTEKGTRRSTQGELALQRDDDGTLRGTFSSNAAQSSGVATARRPRQ